MDLKKSFLILALLIGPTVVQATGFVWLNVMSYDPNNLKDTRANSFPMASSCTCRSTMKHYANLPEVYRVSCDSQPQNFSSLIRS